MAINCIDASADFLAKTKRIILVPVFYFLVMVGLIIGWIFCIICIHTIGTVKPSTGVIPQYRYITFDDADYRKEVMYVELFMFFGILWIVAFIEAKTDFIALVGASQYYFTSNEDVEGEANLTQAFGFAYFKHAGSLALGSFIIAVIRMIRVIFVKIAEEANKISGENPAVLCITRCANCLLACLEKICDYINTAAYAMVAVSGQNFCISGWNGFLLNLKHCAKFGWSQYLASLFIHIGRISITIINCFALIFIMKYVTKDYE